MPNKTLRQRFYEIGCRLSDRGADVAGHPNAIILVLLSCALGFLLLGDDGALILTFILSILAITLTQMVLNQQKRHEAALHLKIDELIHAMVGARDDLMGIEHKSEAELEALRITGDKAEEVLEQRRSSRATTSAG